MIKEETKTAIREKPLDYRQALLRFIYSTMTATEFADAFWDTAEDEWSDSAQEIADAFEADLPEPDPWEMDGDDASRMHDAICEGRRDDAIAILQELFPYERLRSVAEQRNLFPDRVPA